MADQGDLQATLPTDGGGVSIAATSIVGDAVLSVRELDAPSAEQIASAGDGIDLLGSAMEVSLGAGTLTGMATVSFAVPEGFSATDGVPVVVWQDVTGEGFEAVETSWAPGDRFATAEVSHFSWGFLGKIDPRKIAGKIGDWFKSLLTGTAGVANPTCGDEAAARAAGIDVHSDGGDLTKWCYGVQDGRSVLKVTNNWAAGQSVSFPRSWKVAAYQGAGVGLQAIGDWLDSISGPASETLSRLVPSGGTITLEPDGPGDVEVAPSMISWMWSIALSGVGVLLAIESKLASEAKNVSKEALLDSVEFTACFTDSFGEQADPHALTAPVAAESTTSTLSKVAKFALDCGNDALQEWAKTGGVGTVGTWIIGAVGKVVGTAYALVKELFAGLREIGNEIGDLFDDSEIGGFGYDIVLTAAAPPAPTPLPANDDPTVEELMNAAIPSICGLPATQLVDGHAEPVYDPQSPPGSIMVGASSLSDLDGDGDNELAVVFFCNGGGVGFPDDVAVFDDGLRLLADFNIGDPFPEFPTWRGKVNTLEAGPAGWHVTVTLEQDALTPTADRAFDIVWDGSTPVTNPYPPDATAATGAGWPYGDYWEVPQLGAEPVRGSGCGADSPIGEVIPDGVWHGRIDFDTSTDHFEFDLDCVYYGDAALAHLDEWMATHDPAQEEPPGSVTWYVINNSERTRAVPVADGFFFADGQWNDAGECPYPGPNSPGTSSGAHVLPIWLVVSGGQATLGFVECPNG